MMESRIEISLLDGEVGHRFTPMKDRLSVGEPEFAHEMHRRRTRKLNPSSSCIFFVSSRGELESGSAVTGSPHSKGDAHALDLCSPRRSLARRREAARNSVFATRLVLNMVPALQCLPPATLERSARVGFPRVIDHRSLIIWPRPRAASEGNSFGEKFANYAHIFPEYYV